MKHRIITLFVFFLMAQFAFGQDKYQKIDSFLIAHSKKMKFNGNVLIAEKGIPIYIKSFGLANEETKEQLHDTSIFELASITKQFTAMAIVMLKENGKLNYEDKMSKYIPELSFYQDITLRNLLNHTSGLPDFVKIMNKVYNKNRLLNNDDLVAAYAKLKKPLLFKPGSKFTYSNTGYMFLATVIEKITGISYSDYLNKVIFKPLKMNNTYVYQKRNNSKKIANYANGHINSDKRGEKYVLAEFHRNSKNLLWFENMVGSRGVFSTTIDLLKWDRALYTNELISDKSRIEMFSHAVLLDSSKINYGFGFEIQDNTIYGKLLMHGGGWPGYMTKLDRHTDNDKTIIVLLNYWTKDTYFPINELCKLAYDIEPTKFINLSKKENKKFVGTYKYKDRNVIKIILKNDKLYRRFDNGAKLELRPITANKFQLIGFVPEVFLEFVIKDNKVEKLISTQPELKNRGEFIKKK